MEFSDHSVNTLQSNGLIFTIYFNWPVYSLHHLFQLAKLIHDQIQRIKLAEKYCSLFFPVYFSAS